MADAFVDLEAQDKARDLTPAEWLALLLDREAANRGTKRFQSPLRAARLRYSQASVEDVDYRTQRRLDKALCRWIAEHRKTSSLGDVIHHMPSPSQAWCQQTGCAALI
jgi:hypothetical protein